ncbi:SPOR domain-containing protein [Fundidesulfovibrio terrae]|uniref:SPOR domain-containing protein n=1 Tax=Fundidesulfovibrio terrae TaxID=2922866 RepID=UPI001FAFE1F3|nr:SPOR domain-containing protein [Fundidesulfovibrio terrae]
MRLLFASLLVVLAATQAIAQDWQVRAICDLRKGGGASGRAAECAQLAAEVLMLLPEKAGPGNFAVLAEFTDNIEKAGVNWDAPCRDQAHCPDSAYTVRYAFVSKKILTIPKDKIFTALVCREGFSDTAPDDSACRLKLMKVLREMTTRARREGALLAVIKCGAAEGDAVRPDGQGVAGYELTYAFVQLPDMLPMAGNDPKAAAKYAVDQIAGPHETASAAPGKQASSPTSAAPAPPKPAAQSAPPSHAGQALAASAPAVSALASPVSAGPGVQAPAGQAQTAPPPSAPALAPGEILMQVAALPSLVQAETVADRLSAKGIESSFERTDVNGKEVFRVLAKGKGSPDAFRQKLAEMGYPGAIQRR